MTRRWTVFVLAAFALLTVAWGQISSDPLENEPTWRWQSEPRDMWGYLRQLSQKLDKTQSMLDTLTRKVTKLQRSVDSLTVLVDKRTKLPDGGILPQEMPDMGEMREYFDSRGWRMP